MLSGTINEKMSAVSRPEGFNAPGAIESDQPWFAENDL